MRYFKVSGLYNYPDNCIGEAAKRLKGVKWFVDTNDVHPHG